MAPALLPPGLLDDAGEGQDRTAARGDHAAEKHQGLAAAGDFAPGFEDFAFLGGVEELAAEGGGDRAGSL